MSNSPPSDNSAPNPNKSFITSFHRYNAERTHIPHQQQGKGNAGSMSTRTGMSTARKPRIYKRKKSTISTARRKRKSANSTGSQSDGTLVHNFISNYQVERIIHVVETLEAEMDSANRELQLSAFSNLHTTSEEQSTQQSDSPQSTPRVSTESVPSPPSTSHLFFTTSGDLLKNSVWRVLSCGAECHFMRNFVEEEMVRRQQKRLLKEQQKRIREMNQDAAAWMAMNGGGSARSRSSHNGRKIRRKARTGSSSTTTSSSAEVPSISLPPLQSKPPPAPLQYSARTLRKITPSSTENYGGILFWLNIQGYLYICMDREACARNRQLSLWTQLKIKEIHDSSFCIKVVSSTSQIDSMFGGSSGSATGTLSSLQIPKSSSTQANKVPRKRILKMAVGVTHLMFETQHRQLYAMGRGRYGACGTGIESEWIGRPIEVVFQIPSETYLKKMRCGEHFSLLLLGNGECYGCGSNHFGELGNMKKRVLIPQLIQLPSNLETSASIIDMDCSSRFSVFITNEWKIYCCGSGAAMGQKGDIFVPHQIDLTSFRCLSESIKSENEPVEQWMDDEDFSGVQIVKHTDTEPKRRIPSGSPRGNTKSKSPVKKTTRTWEQLLQANNLTDSLQDQLVTKSEDDFFNEFRVPEVERVFCANHEECTFFVTRDQRVFFLGRNRIGVIPTNQESINQPTEVALKSLKNYHPSVVAARKKALTENPNMARWQLKASIEEATAHIPEEKLHPKIVDIYADEDSVFIIRSFQGENETEIELLDRERENAEYGL